MMFNNVISGLILSFLSVYLMMFLVVIVRFFFSRRMRLVLQEFIYIYIKGGAIIPVGPVISHDRGRKGGSNLVI